MWVCLSFYFVWEIWKATRSSDEKIHQTFPWLCSFLRFFPIFHKICWPFSNLEKICFCEVIPDCCVPWLIYRFTRSGSLFQVHVQGIPHNSVNCHKTITELAYQISWYFPGKIENKVRNYNISHTTSVLPCNCSLSTCLYLICCLHPPLLLSIDFYNYVHTWYIYLNISWNITAICTSNPNMLSGFSVIRHQNESGYF